MLDIVVCAKMVTDPEAPASTFKIDPAGGRVTPAAGVPPVVNPYDENALEAALRLKDGQPCRIIVISAGKTVPGAVIKKCLAVGADDLVVIKDEVCDDADSHTTARLLAAAVEKLGEFDLVLAGRMAADTNAGQVGPGLAELLGIAAVTNARKVDVEGGLARVERALADGYELVEAGLPCLVTVSHELGEMRAANVKELMAARKQPFATWRAADLEVDTTSLRRRRTVRLFIPQKEVVCELIDGESPEEAGAALAVRLSETGII